MKALGINNQQEPAAGFSYSTARNRAVFVLALIGASTGDFGTARAQMHLRQMCISRQIPAQHARDTDVPRRGAIEQPGPPLGRDPLLVLLEWAHQYWPSG